MIDAYMVRDPQGRVIGISVYSYRNALNDAFEYHNGPIPMYSLETKFENKGDAAHNGYTLKREQVAL
jgi:hypothetical protein